MWSEEDPPMYSHHIPPCHMLGPSHILLQIGPAYTDIDGAYRGSGLVEEEEGNEGGSTSIE